MVIWCIIAIAALFAAWGLAEAAMLQCIEIVIEDERIPAGFDGATIVFASDMHYGRNVRGKRIEKVVRAINDMQPDYIFLGGDYTEGLPEQTDKAFELLSALKADGGIYAILGNHDIIAGKNETIAAMKAAGLRPLINEGAMLTRGGGSIRLLGVDDLFYGEPNIARAARGTADAFTIALSHNPDFIEDAAVIRDEFDGPGIDWIFAGHTHGGQITFFNKFAFYNANALGNQYRTGIKEHKGIKMYVSNGTGVTCLPFRFFARPDMLLIRLKHKDQV